VSDYKDNEKMKRSKIKDEQHEISLYKQNVKWECDRVFEKKCMQLLSSQKRPLPWLVVLLGAEDSRA